MKSTMIEILGFPYVVRTAPAHASELLNGNELLYGTCNYATQTITIQEGMSEHHTKATLRHEITHAVMFICCLDKESYTNENVCEIIGMHGGTITRIAEQAYQELRERG